MYSLRNWLYYPEVNYPEVNYPEVNHPEVNHPEVNHPEGKVEEKQMGVWILGDDSDC